MLSLERQSRWSWVKGGAGVEGLGGEGEKGGQGRFSSASTNDQVRHVNPSILCALKDQQ